MPITGYVIRYETCHRERVLQALRVVQGVMVGDPTPQGVPVAVETDNAETAMAMEKCLQSLHGVHSATLVYHNFEDAEYES